MNIPALGISMFVTKHTINAVDKIQIIEFLKSLKNAPLTKLIAIIAGSNASDAVPPVNIAMIAELVITPRNAINKLIDINNVGIKKDGFFFVTIFNKF